MKLKIAVAVFLSIFIIFTAGVLVVGVSRGRATTSAPETSSTISTTPASTSATQTTSTATTQGGYTLSEVSAHNSVNDCWLIINNKVYDVTSYLQDSRHPGGTSIVVPYCGSDATQGFDTKGTGQNFPHSGMAQHMLDQYYIGDLN